MGGVAPRPNDGLVVRGAYRVVRHPMYTALLCFDFGLFLMTQSVVLLLLLAALTVVVLLLLPVEEKQLEAAYGDQYGQYRKRVWALVPLVY
jgi:protein-S-isoprenylcysteine O-methyltransferase Ste14